MGILVNAVLAAAASPGGGEGEDGIDGGFEGAGVALDLGEEQPALKRGEQCHGEVVGTGAGREVPSGPQSAQSVGDEGAGCRVGLCELAAERPEVRASLAGMDDHLRTESGTPADSTGAGPTA
jgi:hypothetical protein